MRRPVGAEHADRQGVHGSLDRVLALRGVAERGRGEDRAFGKGGDQLIERRDVDATLVEGGAVPARRRPAVLSRAGWATAAASPASGTVSWLPSTRCTSVRLPSARSLAPATMRSGTPRSSQWAYFSPGRIPSRRSTRSRTPAGHSRSRRATASSTTRVPSSSLLRTIGTTITCTGRDAGREDEPDVVAVRHDHRPDGPGRQSPRRLERMLTLVVAVAVRDVVGAGEILAEVV